MSLSARLMLALVFTLALGRLWEMAEFGLDHLAPFQNQLSLNDTMSDLLMGAIGALSGLSLSWLHMRRSTIAASIGDASGL